LEQIRFITEDRGGLRNAGPVTIAIFATIVNSALHSTPILCCTTGVGGGGAGDAIAPPKVFIRWKSRKHPWKSGQNF